MSAAKEAEGFVISQKAKNLLRALELKREKEVINILRDLEPLGVTADILKKTQIGIIVNGIRRNEDNGEELKRLARDIVFKWKNDIWNVNKDSTSTGTSTNSVDKTVDGKMKSSANILPTSRIDDNDLNIRIKGPNKRFARDRGTELDSILNVSTGDKFRDKCVGLIHSALCSDQEIDKEHVALLAQEIEKYTAEEYGPSSSIYKSRIQSIRFNLRDRSNPDLRNSIIHGELSCKDFSKLTTQQMASAERKLSVEKARKNAMNESVAASDTQAETDMFQCSNCKKRRCKYFQMQTRSSDEPMTTFVSCLNCGKRWKFF